MIRLFRHYVPRSLLLLAIAEVLILMASLYAGVEIRFSGSDAAARARLDPLFPKTALFALVMFAAIASTGLYWRDLREGSWGVATRLLVSFLLGTTAMSIIFYALPAFFIGRGAFGIALGIAFAGVVIARAVHYRLSDRAAMNRRVLVFGAGVKASGLEEELRRKVDRDGITIVGYVPACRERQALDAAKVIAADRPLKALAEEHAIDEIVVAVDDRRTDFPVDELLDCKMAGIDVVDVVPFLEQQTRKIKLDGLHPSSMIFCDGFCHTVLRSLGKRVFDVAASLVLLALTWPIMLLAAAAILLESRGRGPILYRQRRVGRNDRTFQILKLRTMQVDAERDGRPEWAQKNDRRVTKAGGILRRLRIDELPQLLNVLRGEMSFVGPRPERPQFAAQLAERIPYYHLRHRVDPGITGWAQICYPYGASEKDAVEKLQYDLYYIKNYSLLLDFMILLQTVHIVLWGRGAR